MRTRFAALHALVLACTTTGLCAQIFVSPTGSDTTGTGTAGNPYKTISFAATQATPGTTLQLTAGAFGDDEQIVLGSMDLTIAGAGIGLTTIVPHPTLTSTLPSGPLPGTPVEHRVAVTVDGAARIDIRGLTIDGAFRVPSSERLVGVLFRNGADGVLDGVEVKNTRADPLSGSEEPLAALVRGDHATDQCDVTLRSCNVHGIGKAGIVVLFNARATVEYCAVQGAGPVQVGGPVQNGIQIGDGATAVVRFCTVSDLSFAPATSAASGILLANAGANCAVEGNRVTRCDDNVAVLQQPPAAVDTFVRNNKSTQAGRAALRIDGNTRVLVTNNVLHGVDLSFRPVSDTALANNNWLNNNYSDWVGGSYAIPGGGMVDAAARRSCDEFAGQKIVPVGAVLQDLVVDNLDGAGQRDFAAITSGASPSLIVALENAASFAITTIAVGPAAARGIALASGEFDGQPGRDLVLITASPAPQTAENKAYLYANDGAGNFSLLHVAQMPLGAIAPRDVAAGDVNGDGLDDFGVCHLGNTVVRGGGTIYRNNGGGTSWQLAALAGVTLECKGIAMAPIDAGASVDVALTEGNGTTGRVRLYTNDGTGVFAALALGPFAVAPNPTAVAILDTDGDGRREVLATSWGGGMAVQPGSVAVLRNQLPAAMPVQMLPTDLGPTHIAVGNVGNEFDPDTVYPDAVVTNFTVRNLTFLGEFGATGPGQGATCFATANPIATALADMTGDGFADLVIVDRFQTSVTIRLGRAMARADLFGAGCPGLGGRVPTISTDGRPAVPQQPNPNFRIKLANARPSSAAIYLLGFPTGLLAPCTLQVTGAIVLAVPTDASGNAAIPLGISTSHSLTGGILIGQWAVLDSSSPFFGLVSLSQGLVFRIGT